MKPLKDLFGQRGFQGKNPETLVQWFSDRAHFFRNISRRITADQRSALVAEPTSSTSGVGREPTTLALGFVQPLIAGHIAFGTGVTSRRWHRAFS